MDAPTGLAKRMGDSKSLLQVGWWLCSSFRIWVECPNYRKGNRPRGGKEVVRVFFSVIGKDEYKDLWGKRSPLN